MTHKRLEIKAELRMRLNPAVKCYIESLRAVKQQGAKRT
jgi:hypothetical protein